MHIRRGFTNYNKITPQQMGSTKWVQPNGSPCANNHCSTRYEQSFRHNKHTNTSQKSATDKISCQSLSASQTTSRDGKPTQYIEITHPHTVNPKLAFHKVAFHKVASIHQQHLHCRHTTTQSTGSGRGLRR